MWEYAVESESFYLPEVGPVLLVSITPGINFACLMIENKLLFIV